MKNPNDQAPNSKQIPMTKIPISKQFGRLVIGIWNLFGYWNLVIGISFSLTVPLEASTLVDKVVAVVNNEIVTLYELDQAMALKLKSIQQAPNRELAYAQAKQEALNRLIDQKLMDQAVAKSEIEVTSDDLARAINSVLQQNHLSVDDLKRELAAKGIGYESYKENLKKEIKRLKFIQQNLAFNAQVSDREIDDYLEKEAGKQKIMVTLEQIQTPLKSGISQKELKKAFAEAREITDHARKTGNFYPLTGTKVGPVDINDLAPEVARVLRTAEPNTITDPISTATGLIVIKLLTKEVGKATTMNRETAQQILSNQKMENEMSQYVLRLRQKSYIDIRE